MFIYNSLKKKILKCRKIETITNPYILVSTKNYFFSKLRYEKKILKSFFYLIPYVSSKKKQTNKQNKSTKNYLEPLGQNSSTYREWNLGVLNELLIIYIYHNFYRWRILFSKYMFSSFLEQ